VVVDGKWRTLADISAVTGDPEASVSARLRDLRKVKFGGLSVQRRYAGGGLWQYRVLPASHPEATQTPAPRPDVPVVSPLRNEPQGPSTGVTDDPEPPQPDVTFTHLDRMRTGLTPMCPKPGCSIRLGDMRPTVADGYWQGRCTTHGVATVRWSRSDLQQTP
jgi:hypothetical protein